MRWSIASRLGMMLLICLVMLQMRDSICHNTGLSRMDVLAKSEMSSFAYLDYVLTLRVYGRIGVVW